MVRPCFLVIDREFPGSISTRKLVIETAKFNVITAYSADEAIETLREFPAIHGAVLDADIYGTTCEALARTLKEIKPALPIIAICGPGDGGCQGADYQVESLDPRKLLETLQKMDPQKVAEIEQREEELNRRNHSIRATDRH